ncbi:MinD/ParA family protein [bacterium LRH843]|nr:MinD/ParA family protein [bacterium LRH843]
MNDQAENLRRLVEPGQSEGAKVVAVVSGKGGVGKSNVCLNFAISLSRMQKRVAIIDLDIGMANIDILMGVSPSYHIMDLLEGGLSIWDIIEEGPAGIAYIAGGSGFSEFIQLDEIKMERFFNQLELIGTHFDYIFLDMGAGATKSSIQFVMAADDVFVVTTPEPPAITDAYAMVKYIYLHEKDKPTYLIANRVESEKEGLRTLTSFKKVAGQFLQKDVFTLGSIPFDHTVMKAVKAQIPFVLMNEKGAASKALQHLAATYLGKNEERPTTFGHFIHKVRHLFKKERQG